VAGYAVSVSTYACGLHEQTVDHRARSYYAQQQDRHRLRAPIPVVSSSRFPLESHPYTSLPLCIV
jgi:hypothetical protein